MAKIHTYWSYLLSHETFTLLPRLTVLYWYRTSVTYLYPKSHTVSSVIAVKTGSKIQMLFRNHILVLHYTLCPTRYRTRHFFNNSNTNEDIATKFEQGYVHCVRNEEECVGSAPNCCDMEQRSTSQPGSVASGKPCILKNYLHRICVLQKTSDHTSNSGGRLLLILVSFVYQCLKSSQTTCYFYWRHKIKNYQVKLFENPQQIRLINGKVS
jgi:hypothetical protein